MKPNKNDRIPKQSRPMVLLIATFILRAALMPTYLHLKSAKITGIDIPKQDNISRL